MKTQINQSKAIVQHLKDFCLSGIRDSFEELSKKAHSEDLSYEEYLLELLDRESEVRFNKRIERRLKESRLALEKNMDSFDLKLIPRKALQQTKSLLEGDFLDRSENVLAFGNPGSGKTHLLSAICQELIRKGRRIYAMPCSLLVQDLLLAKQNLKLASFFKKLRHFDALLIDDVGYVQHDRAEIEVLFTLLAERYEKGSIMITSNLPFSKWDRIFKDPMTTAAAIDRLVHHSIILELNIPSYRMNQAKAKGLKAGHDSEKNAHAANYQNEALAAK
ncbi:MAG: AAA family ATPase [Omnitrophica bacterium RIFCSPLOWO2_12_FULL_44_17]|uniref:AAA family ATPase n=1 Tax=Candidatus Danuiimicrobium aquiferis TaxID=1801832 RepID=A0A1G1KQZ7_9BACT|nr:MAG: AAA family ATPase [Omnitrophica bacterium RIFCSPHIGHO2_02_FULL_45_28]OGW88084.1 MAG: AAA family ATPase [Omnitrophica bacterium RIFCSPHIGHO2_12_FULL_44_12]OGW95364.1 MAG: AAA family ATPase [Omnitrophica bacterium RIFCSPLOWO2_12_FULL_44_17]OGX04066.1 MAG: AAA family ATPase [Omnitrophica bacterium RIFCSPLOWO2_02_FULL_44_11]